MSKGTRRERECVDILQTAGFGTYRPATVRFGENDIFGLFDILAFSPEYENLIGIQVKSNRATGIRKWKRHTRLFRELGIETYYAVPEDNQGWRLIELTPFGKATVVDERTPSTNMGEGLTEYLQGLTE